jgi:hypothetical protein
MDPHACGLRAAMHHQHRREDWQVLLRGTGSGKPAPRHGTNPTPPHYLDLGWISIRPDDLSSFDQNQATDDPILYLL